ncbi:RNA-directed DNA polymerase, eukaryota, reverse transcriptase zinc-binding domain protein [Tanacetum coccineum]|uniref:RNA-directed DNA polymerase, eukaryota, reverse transcriptase zinc-binding domain protein n=1 Tax=Tanacetum coccineum TaxID=301880 RepID=A0ABQ4YCG6_9ASTR
MWGNYSFDYACSMARGLSGGIISMWDPTVFTKENIWCNDNYVIVQGKWLNITHSYYMVNVYGPQDPVAKATVWNNLITCIQQHHGRYVVFGDLNEVESEWYGTNFSRLEAHLFNSFVDDSGLKEMVMGGKLFTWMNKYGTKMSKLDRFLLSEEVFDDNPDLKAIVLDRLWSDHSPILLHIQKTDYGPTPFKIFHSWFQRKDVDVVVKQAFVDSSQEATRLLHDIDRKIDSSMASNLDKETRLQLLQEIYNIDRLESTDLLQKARIKWDVKGDENTNFFHAKIKKQQRRQAIQGIMLDGMWCSDPVQVKEALLAFYKDKFQASVVSNLVSNEQSAFILGRQILDGPLMLSEIIDWYKEQNQKMMIFKVDFEKAYDSVNWKYLDYVLKFSIKRGLRQGDPLSPFLFVLIMEGLHVTIRDATQANFIKGVSVGNPCIRLSHLFYADDVVLLTEWSHVVMDNIIRLFNVFFLLLVYVSTSINQMYMELVFQMTRLRSWLRVEIGTGKGGVGSVRLYRLELHPNCVISDRFVNGEWHWQWRRIIDSGRCFDMLKALNHIDDVILPTLPVVTSWCKILPRKVNIFIWRLRLDRLPHRFNLSRCGLDIQAIACPVCSKGVESNDHLFFSCDVALNILRLVRIWLDMNILGLITFGLLAKLSFDVEEHEREVEKRVKMLDEQEIGKSSRIDDKVVQDQRQRDDYDLQDEIKDQPKEEEIEPRRSKRARTKKSFGPDLFLLW